MLKTVVAAIFVLCLPAMALAEDAESTELHSGFCVGPNQNSGRARRGEVATLRQDACRQKGRHAL